MYPERQSDPAIYRKRGKIRADARRARAFRKQLGNLYARGSRGRVGKGSKFSVCVPHMWRVHRFTQCMVVYF